MCNLTVPYPVRKPENSKFELGRARELLHLVDVAHQEYNRASNDELGKDRKWEWENDNTSPMESYELLTRFGFAGYFFGKRKRVPFGFILKKESILFVIFRGTEEPQEWIADARAKQVKFFDDEYGPLGEVHKGFHAIYTREDRGGILDFDPDNDLPSIADVVKKTIEAQSGISQIFVAGHSLGGALATLATLHIKRFKPFLSPILYSYASPRVGDSDFAEQLADIDCYRIANSEDRVTNLPWSISFISLITPGSIGELLEERQSWEHIGQPIYFTSQAGSVARNHTIPIYKKALED